MLMALWFIQPRTPMSEVVQFLSRMAQESEDSEQLRSRFESIMTERDAAVAKLRDLLSEEGLSDEAQDILLADDKSEIIDKAFAHGAELW